MPEPIEARQDLPNRCSRCGCRIDKGDSYRIIAWNGGFDYEHADCTRTSMRFKLDDTHEEVPF